MKKAIIFFIPLMFLLSCSKDDEDFNGFSLTGKWKLASACGGFAGCTTASKNYWSILEFKDKELIEQVYESQNATRTYHRNYVIVDKMHQDDKATYQIELEDGTAYTIEVFADYLILSDEMLWKTYNRQ